MKLCYVIIDLQDTAFQSGSVGVVITRPTRFTFSIFFGLTFCLQPKTTWTSGALNTARPVPILHFLAVINCRHLKIKKITIRPSIMSA